MGFPLHEHSRCHIRLSINATSLAHLGIHSGATCRSAGYLESLQGLLNILQGMAGGCEPALYSLECLLP